MPTKLNKINELLNTYETIKKAQKTTCFLGAVRCLYFLIF